MSLRQFLGKAVRWANGVEPLRTQLKIHINNQTAALAAHVDLRTAELTANADRRAAELKAHLDSALKLHEIERNRGELIELIELLARELRKRHGLEGLHIEVRTDKPVACDSPDHLMPWGTRLDNSTNLRFNIKLGGWIPLGALSVLDLGCAGGGFVESVLDMGCLAVGIEGSDYSKVRLRAEWATIPEYLFTADITEPFEVFAARPGEPPARQKFSVVTVWEVLEHVRREQLPAVFRNIDAHLEPNGVAIVTVSPVQDVVNGVALHQTVEGREWWLARFADAGWVHSDEAAQYFGRHWVRDQENAVGSFPLVLLRRGESLPAPLPPKGSFRSREEVRDDA